MQFTISLSVYPSFSQCTNLCSCFFLVISVIVFRHMDTVEMFGDFMCKLSKAKALKRIMQTVICFFVTLANFLPAVYTF